MIHKTPFGLLKCPVSIEKKQIDAVQRALLWCETILTSTLWTPKSVGNNISLQRTINGQTIEIFPLEAAFMDFGIKSRFNTDHLPIHLNNQNACVRSIHPRSRPLHTDMIASMILLLGRADIDSAAVPRTLHAILTQKQIASLPPPPPPRGAYVPGQPSTSGREFLPEPSILELVSQHQNTKFSIQFEKRDGTLRNMTARIGVWKGPNGDEKNPRRVSDEMSYDPSEYNLKIVFDMQKEEYRNIATDRVTQISIGGQTYHTASYNE
ncbi:MAG: hypothetical protein HOL22_03210 [Euryarchaeota archaeon]|jgi:hypothetical protein|nr:hypothetical protein [Euryarchaeota archaeon]